MTHTSAANELGPDAEHNERLEFLGDAVLELCISKELYRRFVDAREGQLTAMRSQLVNQQSLAMIAKKLGLDKCIVLGKGEESQGGRSKETLLCDVFEALLGAIYLDGGYDEACRVIERLFATSLGKVADKRKTKDYKSRLQEITQQIFKGRPQYSLKVSSGPEHNKTFTVILLLPDGREIEASGSSVKRAEQQAAKDALVLLAPEE